MKISKKLLIKTLGYFSFIKANMIPMNNANIRMTLEDSVLTILGHDLFNSVEATLIAEGEPFSKIVPYTKLKSLLNTHGENVEITFDETYLYLSSRGIKNQLVIGQGRHANKPVQQGKQCLELKSSVLVNAVRRAITASSKIGGRPELEAVLFIDKIIGTDTYNTSISEINIPLDFLLGASSTTLLKSLKGVVKISFDEHYAVFETESYTLFCRRMISKYVPYETLKPDVIKAGVNVDRAMFIDFVKNCKIVNEEKITISVDNTLSLSAFGRGGSATIEIDQTLDDKLSMSGSFKITLSPVDLLNGINAMGKAKRLTFEVGLNKQYRKKSLVIYDDDATFSIVEKR